LGNYDSAEEYTNTGMEITIKDASLDLIWLRDGSKWQMYNPALGVPGFWEIGDPVIVTRRIAIKISKIYEMLNIKTGVTLMAVFLAAWSGFPSPVILPNSTVASSQLSHWPVQLALVPVTGPIWQDARTFQCLLRVGTATDLR